MIEIISRRNIQKELLSSEELYILLEYISIWLQVIGVPKVGMGHYILQHAHVQGVEVLSFWIKITHKTNLWWSWRILNCSWKYLPRRSGSGNILSHSPAPIFPETWNLSAVTNNGHYTPMNYVHALKLSYSLLQRNDTITIHQGRAMSCSNKKQIVLHYCTINTEYLTHTTVYRHTTHTIDKSLAWKLNVNPWKRGYSFSHL
jgi:hypothetical protein